MDKVFIGGGVNITKPETREDFIRDVRIAHSWTGHPLYTFGHFKCPLAERISQHKIETCSTPLSQSTMPLTRHFYEADDVHAALSYSSCRVQHQETLFWCKELLVSGYVGEAISTLFKTWMWQRGPFHVRWMIEAWRLLQGTEVTEEAVLLSAYQLSACTRRDGSLWRILAATVSFTDVPPDHVTQRTPLTPIATLPVTSSMSPIESYFIRALYQGKAMAAWWASRYLTEDRVWWLLYWFVDTVKGPSEYKLYLEALQSYEELLGYRTAEYDVVVRCLAVLSVACHDEKTWSALPLTIDARYHATLETWDIMEGRRERRQYSIPRGCLAVIRPSLYGLYDVESGIQGCPFWEEALTEYARGTRGHRIQWVSDDAMEAFYDTFFPDDIPDEWTKVEKEKSHIPMVYNVKKTVSRSAYVRLYQPSVARLSWVKPLPIVDSADCCLASIVTQFPVITGMPLEKELAPRKKQWRIV